MTEPRVLTPTEVAQEYFLRGDAGRPDVLDLIAENAQVYFPKFGVAKDRAALLEMVSQFAKSQGGVTHTIDNYICQGNFVVAEGRSTGVTARGIRWSGGETPAGRFCNVFEVQDGLIARLYIYLDPDYGSEHLDRFLWGQDRTSW